MVLVRRIVSGEEHAARGDVEPATPCWNRTRAGLEEDDEAAWRERLGKQLALLEEDAASAAAGLPNPAIAPASAACTAAIIGAEAPSVQPVRMARNSPR